MISDGYSATLKKLISFTQAKFIALADVVGYDVSYVNKWRMVQSCRLPAM